MIKIKKQKKEIQSLNIILLIHGEKQFFFSDSKQLLSSCIYSNLPYSYEIMLSDLIILIFFQNIFEKSYILLIKMFVIYVLLYFININKQYMFIYLFIKMNFSVV